MSSALLLTVYALTFAVGLPANLFTLTTLAAKSRRRPAPPGPALTAADLLLLNLTAADLLLLVILPFKMAEAAAGQVWPLPAALCPLANFCFYSSMYLSALFLAALSVRRYLGVAFPLRLQGQRRGRGLVLAVSAVIWVLVCGHCSVVFVAEFTRAADGGGGGGGDFKVNHADRLDAKSFKPVDPKSFGFVDSKANSVDLDDLKTFDPVDRLDHKVLKLVDPKTKPVDPIDPKTLDLVDPKTKPVDPNDPKTFNPVEPKTLDLIDPKTNPVDPIDLVDPVDPKTLDLVDPKTNPVDLNDLKILKLVDHVDPKVNPIDLKTPNHADPRTSNPKFPKTPNSVDPKTNPIDPIDPKMNPVDPIDLKTSNPKIPKTLKLIDPKTNPIGRVDPKTKPKFSKTPNPKFSLTPNSVDPNPNPNDPIDLKTNPKFSKTNPKFPKSPNPIDPKTNPVDPIDPKTPNPKFPKTPNPIDPKTNPVDPIDPKTPNSIDPKTPNPKSPKTPNSVDPNPNPIGPIDPIGLIDPKPNPKPPKPPTPTPPRPAPFHCYDDFSAAQLRFVLPLRLEFFFVLFLLPFSVTAFCYAGFVRALLARPALPAAKRRRAVGLAVASVAIFGLCFAPYNVSHVVGFVQGRSPGWRVYATLLSGLNAALDPLVFYCSSGAVRQALAGVGEGIGAWWGRWRK